MPQTLEQILASRKSLYDPQRELVQQQLNALPGQEQAQQAGLETAKTNAFGDIVNTSNARGVLYSGAPIQEQSRYVGEKYLPAVANLKAQTASNQSKLAMALLGINQDEATNAEQIQSAQQKAEAEAAYRQQQLAMQQQRLRLSASRSARQKAPTKQDTYADFSDDLRGAFSGFGARPTEWTEKVIIPKLAAAYPELTAPKLKELVYAYRKANFGM